MTLIFNKFSSLLNKTYISRCLFFFTVGAGSESWSNNLLSKVLSEFGDFFIVMPIFAFLTPSSLEIGLTFKGVTFLNKAHVKNMKSVLFI